MGKKPVKNQPRFVTPPALAAVERAKRSLHRILTTTPLLPLSDAIDIMLKAECLLAGGSFKLRGVYNWASQLEAKRRKKGLQTFSAGNTALALGRVARLFRVPARSYIPDNTPAGKRAALGKLGVQTIPIPMAELMERMSAADQSEDGWCVLHPWHDPQMLAGSATIGFELSSQMPEVETVFIPVGGGGLAAAIGSTLKRIKPSVRIIAVEAEAAPALYQSFKAGHPVQIILKPTICHSVAVPLVSEAMYPLLRQVIDEVVMIAEDAVKDAIRRLATGNKLFAEGAGALATAAALAMPHNERGKSVAIVSGGNIDKQELMKILRE